MRAVIAARCLVLLNVLFVFSVPLLRTNWLLDDVFMFSMGRSVGVVDFFCVFVAFETTLMLLVASVVELALAHDEARTWRSALAYSVAAAAVALVTAWAGFFQLFYTATLMEGGTTADALGVTRRAVDCLLETEGQAVTQAAVFTLTLFVLSVPVGPLVFARLTRRRLVTQVGIVAAVWIVAASPSLLYLGNVATALLKRYTLSSAFGPTLTAYAVARAWWALGLSACLLPVVAAGIDRGVSALREAALRWRKSSHTD